MDHPSDIANEDVKKHLKHFKHLKSGKTCDKVTKEDTAKVKKPKD